MPQRISKRLKILNMLDGNNIIILGMMGCGKSTIGRMLASKLSMKFLDADSEIEEAAGRNIAEIFADYGEEEFRRLEQRVIERVLNEGPVLLALGGGAFMADETRKVISENALSIWIKADLDLLLKRVLKKPGKRPLLTKGNPREILQNLLKEREPIYALADLHISSIDSTKSEMRDHAFNALHDYLEQVQ